MKIINLNLLPNDSSYYFSNVVHDGREFLVIVKNSIDNSLMVCGESGNFDILENPSNDISHSYYNGLGPDGKFYFCNFSFNPRNKNKKVEENWAVFEDDRLKKIKDFNDENLIRPIGYGDFCDLHENKFVACKNYFGNSISAFNMMFNIEINNRNLIFTNRRDFINWIVEIPGVDSLGFPKFSLCGSTVAVFGFSKEDKDYQRKLFILDVN